MVLDARFRGTTVHSSDFLLANTNTNDYSNYDFTDTIFDNVNLDDLNIYLFNNSNFFGATLINANLTGASLFNANLSGANLFNANLSGASLFNANLSGANLSNANLTGANLQGTNLSYVIASQSNLSGTDLSQAILSETIFTHADLSDVIFTGADLTKVKFIQVNLSGANLIGSNLSGANLSGANLINAKLNGANLSGTIFTDTTLSGANFNNARFTSQTNGTNISIELSGMYSYNFPPGWSVINGTLTYTEPSCLNEGTVILCENDQYVLVEDIRVGTLVKTLHHGYKKVGAIGKNVMLNDPSKWYASMYKMSKSESMPGDLIITGGHSVMVDKLSETQIQQYKAWGIEEFSIQTIDSKHLLLSAASKDFVQIKDSNKYTYYLFYLKGDEEDQRFWVWANGVFVETPSKSHYDKQTLTPL